ncbi:hypothetical protein CEXT_44851 [Caerostris extrusa]|uniref:Uncharacterized protein n=1 Tax=Caerostris extrusa TaxID=172846 RepID=A0AAV4TU01_CAEEX|nr:hypothetical protein CEXT_44851 [Caerostris extrusa]
MLRHKRLDPKVDRSVEISLLKIVRPAGRKKIKIVHRPRIEPGQQASILPLYHRCCVSRVSTLKSASQRGNFAANNRSASLLKKDKNRASTGNRTRAAPWQASILPTQPPTLRLQAFDAKVLRSVEISLLKIVRPAG